MPLRICGKPLPFGWMAALARLVLGFSRPAATSNTAMLSMFYSNFTMLYSSLICPKPLVNFSNLPMTISSNTMTIFNMTVIYTWAFLSVLAL